MEKTSGDSSPSIPSSPPLQAEAATGPTPPSRAISPTPTPPEVRRMVMTFETPQGPIVRDGYWQRGWIPIKHHLNVVTGPVTTSSASQRQTVNHATQTKDTQSTNSSTQTETNTTEKTTQTEKEKTKTRKMSFKQVAVMVKTQVQVTSAFSHRVKTTTHERRAALATPKPLTQATKTRMARKGVVSSPTLLSPRSVSPQTQGATAASEAEAKVEQAVETSLELLQQLLRLPSEEGGFILEELVKEFYEAKEAENSKD